MVAIHLSSGALSWKLVYRSLLPLFFLWTLCCNDVDKGVNAFVTRPPASFRSSRAGQAPPRWALYDTSPEGNSYFSDMEQSDKRLGNLNVNGDTSSFLNQTNGDSVSSTAVYPYKNDGIDRGTQLHHHHYLNATDSTSTSNGVDYEKNGNINGFELTQNATTGATSTSTITSNGADYKKNGNGLMNGFDQKKKNGSKPKERANGNKPEHLAILAPEVTHWTEIMSQGWNDALCSTTTTNWDSVLTDFDLGQIEQYWGRLMPTVSYLGTAKVAKIYQSLCVAYRAHRGQMRKSGEPYIIHPVEVGMLLSGLKMDAETVMAGLLHDTVEDTDLTFAQVESLFGYTVRSIVEGETKVSKLPKLAFTDYADEQAENLRQMFVAMTDDYRIIICKLADRLHNMRTLRHMKPEKQIKISRETLDIFAPLAHRMGIWQFKSELEDTAFMYLYPQEYKRLNRRLRQHQSKFRETLDKSQELLQQRVNIDPTLTQQAAKVEVFGRTKEIYSLWHKMETKGEHNLDQIVDVVALRVIITPEAAAEMEGAAPETDRGVWLCYHVLGLVQHLPGFQPVPTRVKDYISFPKPNGYQSLHTALILDGQTIEVQIRTSLMHQVAEYGMASHWAYTDDKRRGEAAELFNTPWLSSIKEWQNDRISSRDFVDSVRRELLGKRVFVFLRNGKILNLSRGATAIDAAFQIHTEVGLTMHGVEINGKPRAFSYELQNGDVVSIQTGQGKPATDWMRYAKSRSTRSKLRSYFRDRQKDSLSEAGEMLLMDYLWMHGPLIESESFLEHDFVIPTTLGEVAKFLPGKTRYTDLDEMLIFIGKNHDRAVLHKIVSQLFGVPKKILVAAEENKQVIVPSSVVEAVHERRRSAKDAAQAAFSGQTSDTIEESVRRSQGPVTSTYSVEKMLAGIDTPLEYADPEHLCEECLPVHGDEVVGTRPPDSDIITTVHRIGCPRVQRAINRAVSEQKMRSLAASVQRNSTSMADPRPRPRVDSVTLRQYNVNAGARRTNNSAHPKYVFSTTDVPVRLQWSDLDENKTLFLTEVVVHAQDRKLLLADCSEVVSETVEILKTGSASTEEHCTLVFLVRASCLDNLQQLMDRLGLVRSVMSVERRFGSELS